MTHENTSLHRLCHYRTGFVMYAQLNRTDGLCYLATVDVLDGALPEQKVHVRIGLERADELGLVQPLGVVVLGPQIRGAQVPDDGRVYAGKVHRAAREVLAVERDHGRDVGQRAVRAFADSAHRFRHAVGIFHLYIHYKSE